MANDYVRVYDQNNDLQAVLENAGDVGYSLAHNDLWTASFTLPTADPKNAACQAHSFVRLPDGPRDTGLYRIISMPSGEEAAASGVKQYSMEHVMAMLLDDVLFGYHEVGGAEMPTGDVIAYILSRQTTARWVLGECDFTDQFAYKFENVSLLSALLSLGGVLTSEYIWVWDTSVTPWRVSLKRADSTPGCGIHYRRNMLGVTKSMDAGTLVTRLYLLGYGEGVNQLTIKEVNGGLPYIDADTVGVWGVKCSVYPDTRIEDAATLKARGQAVLEKVKNPYISYTASAVDLAQLTGDPWDTFMPGKLVRVMDGEHGINFSARIVTVGKGDVRGRSGDIQITIANVERDVAGSVSALADRMAIGELYSQGATNLYSQQYADNADAAHPAEMRVFVPQGCVRINKMLLSWKLEPFRAYETGAAAGGGTTRTTSSGGGTTVSKASDTSTANNVDNTGPASGSTGGASTEYTGSSGTLTSNSGGTGSTGSPSTNQTGSASAVDGHTHSLSTHSHTGPSHTHTVSGHTHSMQGHTHNLGAHTHSLNEHTHGIPSHSHTVPSHTHGVTLDDHTHGIVYGIYEGGTAAGIALYVDGTLVPAGAVTDSEMDIVSYLAKDANGRITRGAWHTISIVPNALTRIEANLFVQAFIQSVGGGDF